MHIISKFKDFYDYLQFSFGQDDNIYWDRNFIDNKSDKLEFNVKFDKYKYNLKRTGAFQFANNSVCYFNYISIIGKSYPIVFKHFDNNFKSKFLSTSTVKPLTLGRCSSMKDIGDLYNPEVLTFTQNVHNRIKNGKFIYNVTYHQCILSDGSIYTNGNNI